MADISKITVTQGSDTRSFNGSWYRGEHTRFIPSKPNLCEPDAISKYILDGWLPKEKFISKSSKITAFGSCFARHIGNYLHKKNYSIMGRGLNLNSHIIRFGEGMVNTFSIAQQLEWALENKEMPDKLWFGPNKEIASLDPAIKEETKNIILQTDVFIITLGLSEIWYDKESGEAFWRAIPKEYFDENRHGFRVSTVEENTANLETIIRVIKKNRPQAHILFTLSPIPLMATFRPMSCVTASCVSKAILRIALDQLFSKYSNDWLHYYPSYEIVKEYFVDPFRDDNRHVKNQYGTEIMEVFENCYCK